MRRKPLIIFLVIIAAILGPAIYAQKFCHPRQAPELSAAANPAAALNGARQPGGEQASFPESSNQEANQKFGAKDQEITSPAANGSPGAPVRQINANSGSRDTSGQEKESSANEAQAGPNSSPADRKKQAGSTTPAENGEKEKDQGCPVGIAVIGMNGELLYGPEKVTVTEKNFGGITALGALDATGLPYATSRRWAIFVEAIAGQRNKGQAGWMYQVNGEIPLTGADRKPLKAGDQVIWWYSKSIDTRPPAWDQLCKQ
jgi:hypothetical protein